ncbi:unnamed protein product [Rhizophagus irregularis]|nr:unnamed protein product [Rhizophagus irregularis]CAB5353325.1 unnamed protein product [Rhizophagus irregularis]
MNEIMLHYTIGGGSVIMLYGITQDPKTKNYMMHDNIISDEFSGSLQIDVSRLNINDEQTDEDKEEMEMMD